MVNISEQLQSTAVTQAVVQAAVAYVACFWPALGPGWIEVGYGMGSGAGLGLCIDPSTFVIPTRDNCVYTPARSREDTRHILSGCREELSTEYCYLKLKMARTIIIRASNWHI